MKKHVLPILLTAFVLCTSCNKTPDKIISINPNQLTTEDQVNIGAAFQLVLESDTNAFRLLDKAEYPNAHEYVEKLFYTMLNTAQVQRRQDFDWSVHILQDDSVRTAFFLPGGHFYIYTGLLKYLDTEGELLGVIGHELFYVDSDLLVERIREEFGGVMLGDILLENPVPELPDFVEKMPFLSFGEKDVRLADAFAVQLICPFLYEPSGIRKILERAALEENLPLWLRTHQGKFQTRLMHLDQETAGCGLPGVSNEENYLTFKLDYLP